jgi:ATP-binding cassette, subfamily A (ABC1), member 3
MGSREDASLASPTAHYRRSTDANAARKTSFHFVPTLLRKNWWLKQKDWVGLLLEILIPVALVAAMGIVKRQTTEYDVQPGFSENDRQLNLFQKYGGDGNAVIAPLFAPKYATQETSLTGLLLHMDKLSFEFARGMKTFDATQKAACQREVAYGGKISLNASSPYAVPSVCEDRVSPFKLAIAPDVPFTRQYFFETVSKWYPTITFNVTDAASMVVPSLADSVVFYDTEKELEDYIKSKDYAATASQPRIFGAVVFDQFPAESSIGAYAPIEYTLRLNATFVRERADDRYVPRTADKDASTWDRFQRDIDTLSYQQYASGGFMTLQTLVARFANCMPTWDTMTKSTTGECQAANSVAKSSAVLDTRLLQTVTNDPAAKQAIADMLQTAQPTAVPPQVLNWSLTTVQEEALLKPLRQAPQPYLGSITAPFPITEYPKSTFYDITQLVFPIVFLVTYLVTLSKILVSLISERETGARELMKILGVKESSIVISWYITYTAILFVSSILQVAAARIGLFVSSNILVIFLFFFLFNMSILGFVFMVSSVFSNSRTGTYIGIIGFFLLYAVSNAFTDSSPELSKNLASLLAPSAMVFAVQTLAKTETTHIGVNFSNISTPINNYRFSTALWMFTLDAILYTLIGLYLEKVVPKTYGTPEKWYFPVSPAYWRKRRGPSKAPVISTAEGGDVTIPVNPNIEPVSADLAEQERTGAALCVQGMRKVFPVPGGEKVAVKGVHLNMYSGQITCLLGHNGAGKTTLISMLTGVLEASSGDAFFRGLSIREDMDEIRVSLGICFQHDVLYPSLTVAEHLDFYARIKGYTGAELDAEIEHKIAEVGLRDKRDVLSSSLSGGMKRKLSVAISLLGDSALVFLDEPTSGMDPYSRRSTWEILMANRRDRVLVLTTHFMDEADILGDRIAIMAEGELRCSGSSLFLKNRYGAGYNLTIVKEEGCDDSKVIDFVLGRIPSGRLLSNVGAEVAFQLPLDTSEEFPELFRSLDAQLSALGLLSYGISVTTLEEVFIKVAEAADDEHNQQHTLQNKVKQHDEVRAETKSLTSFTPAPKSSRASASERSLFWIQFKAVFQKRLRVAKRDKKYGLVSILLPIVWLVFGLLLLQSVGLTKVDPKITLSTEGLTKAAPKNKIVVPAYCQTSVGDWCSSVIDDAKLFAGVLTVIVDAAVIGDPPYADYTPKVLV